jgi:hypothetical protein
MPTGPPHPALQNAGFNGSIVDFNNRLAAAVSAHVRTAGTRPSPGLAFDLARSALPVEQFEPLLTVTPKMSMQVRARQALALHPLETYTGQSFIDGMKAAAKAGSLHDYLTQNQDDIGALAAKDKGFAAKLAPLLRQGYESGQFNEAGTPLGGVAKVVNRGVTQVVSGLVHSPGALYNLGKTIYKGDKGVVDQGINLGRPTPKNQAEQQQAADAVGNVLRGTVTSVKEDILHPTERPGFLFLDVLGLAAPVTRFAAGTRALATGEGLTGVELAVTKRAGGTVEIGRPGATENALVSEHPAIAALQRWNLARRQSNLEAAVTGDDTPAGLRSILLPNFAQDFLDRNFSFERKLGREADARQRVQHIVDTSLANELDSVASGTLVQSRALSRMPNALRRGLSRGEQKAIQTLSFGTTPDEQIGFHQRMIDAEIGDSKAHLRQIGDLKLAKKVLANPNPSDRFSRAVELTQQVVEQAQAQKIDALGLSPVTAEARVGHPGAVFREQDLVKSPSGETFVREQGSTSLFALERDLNQAKTVLAGEQRKLATLEDRLAKPPASGVGRSRPKLKAQVDRQRQAVADWTSHVSEAEARVVSEGPKLKPLRGTAQEYPATGPVEPFYSKLETGRKNTPSARGGYYASRPSKFGEGPPALPPELTNELSGKSIVNGKFRIDATALTTEAMARTVRAATVLSEHEKHWLAGTDLPRSKWDMPIRDKRVVSEKLRAALNAIEDNAITSKEAVTLPADMQEVLNELYVLPEDFERQHGPMDAVKEPIPGIKFFDRRSIGSASNLGAPAGARGAMKVLEALNEVPRDLTLFVRPAYALNALGNGAMLAFDQGFAAIPNVAWALQAKSALGEEAYRVLTNLGGVGKAKSYASGLSLKPGRALASGWNILTDRVFRVAAIRHYAREMGYTTDAEFRDLLLSGGKDLVEATRRANKSLVEFDNLTPVEADYLRHIIFVYPWVSRSAVWSLRSIFEHPIKTDALAQLGQQEANSDPIFQHVPEWFKRTGYFPISWTHDGVPLVVNPTSVNTFSTLSDMLSVGQAGAAGDRYSSLEGLFGPGITFLVHGATGRDQYGNTYVGSQWLGAAKEVLGQLPQVSAYSRGGKAKSPALKPADIEKRGSLEARFNSGLKRTVFSPGWLDGYGTLIAGGLSPRPEDQQAATARFWRDQTPEARHGLERWFLNRALDVQGELLKQSVPGAVRDGVKVAADLSFEASRFAKANGRTPTEQERAELAIDYFVKRGSLDSSKGMQLRRELRGMVDPTEIKTLANKVVMDYGNGKAVSQWDQNVRLVASFKAPVFAQKAAELHKQGIIDSVPKPSQSALYEYGRQYLAFKDAATKLGEKVKAGKATPADLRAFEDEHDKPVNGLPSFVRTAWAYNTPDQQAKALKTALKASWSSLSGFEKQLLVGKPVDAKVSEAWAMFTDNVAKARESLPPGERRIKASDKLRYAKELDSYYGLHGAFVADYKFSRQPLFARALAEKPIQNSPNRAEWQSVLSDAKKAWVLHTQSPDVYPTTDLRDQWHDFVRSDAFQAWLDSLPKFKAEVAAYGGTSFLTSLL